MNDDFFDFMDDDDESNPDHPDEKLPRKRGRPRGSKNRPKETLVTRDRLEALYNRVQPYLNSEQKKYIQGVLNGSNKVEPMYEMQLLVRQMSLLFGEAMVAYWEEKKVDQNIAKFSDSLRMAIKDLADLERVEKEKADKQKEKDGLVSITERGSTMERLKALSGEDFP